MIKMIEIKEVEDKNGKNKIKFQDKNDRIIKKKGIKNIFFLINT